ncbi:MAG: DNA ligase LigA-related protein, partial [Alphaproteobacteria bacterium]
MTDDTTQSPKTMSEDEARAAHAQLADEVRAHNAAYYQNDAPVVSDGEYDMLFQRLLALEVAFPPLATEDSPTQRVGAAPSQGFAKVPHNVPMLSLGNAFDDEDVGEFLARIRRFLNLTDEDDLEI